MPPEGCFILRKYSEDQDTGLFFHYVQKSPGHAKSQEYFPNQKRLVGSSTSFASFQDRLEVLGSWPWDRSGRGCRWPHPAHSRRGRREHAETDDIFLGTLVVGSWTLSQHIVLSCHGFWLCGKCLTTQILFHSQEKKSLIVCEVNKRQETAIRQDWNNKTQEQTQLWSRNHFLFYKVSLIDNLMLVSKVHHSGSSVSVINSHCDCELLKEQPLF